MSQLTTRTCRLGGLEAASGKEEKVEDGYLSLSLLPAKRRNTSAHKLPAG